MNNNKIFAKGIIIKTHNSKYGEFKTLSFKIDEFRDFISNNSTNGWINLKLEKNKEGKEYFILNEFKPQEKKEESEISIEDIPFK